MDHDDLQVILADHQKWLADPEQGKRADLSRQNLIGAQLPNVDLRQAILYQADLSNADLTHANLCGSDLRGAHLVQATLDHAWLADANLEGALLCPARLAQTRLWDINLRDADLEGADLSEADLSGADLRDANLTGITLTDTDLSHTGVIALTAGPYQGCVTSTHFHMGCVRLALQDLPADDDEVGWDEVDSCAWDWWCRYGRIVRAAIETACEIDAERFGKPDVAPQHSSLFRSPTSHELAKELLHHEDQPVTVAGHPLRGTRYHYGDPPTVELDVPYPGQLPEKVVDLIAKREEL